jgi:6-phosphofructokinase 1
VSASQTEDKFKNIEFGAMGGSSVGLNLHRMISDEFGFRGEFQITESLIMSAMDRSVPQDIEEAYQCGVEAVKLAEKGESGFMVTIERTSEQPYRAGYGKARLNDVAIKAKPMPTEYFNKEGNFVSDLFYDYMQPLVGEIPEFVRLEKKMIQ